MAVLRLEIPGEPRGKGRPRFARVGAGVRTFTDNRTATAEAEIKDAWTAAGRVRLPDGPLVVELVAMFARPAGHYRANGSLSAVGLRSPAPTKKPDADNILKMLDALNGLAWTDDAQIVQALITKRWARREEGETPGLVIVARPLTEALYGLLRDV